ncbi:hypothetical protein AgCh_023088 [Apium graveolens]
MGKHHKIPFPIGKSWRARERLELIHTDICGPMKAPSLGKQSEECEESDEREVQAHISESRSEDDNKSPPRKWRRLSDIYQTCNFIVGEPETFEEAMKHDIWQQAMEEEMHMIEKFKTWELVDKPEGREIIGLKWIYKTKLNQNGEIQKYKARLVAKGFTQKVGIDFSETLSPVARLETIRTLIALAAQKRWKNFQLDVKSAFLNEKLDEEVYVEQPQGNDKTMMQGFKEHMMKAYEMSDLGLLHCFLGVEVTQKPEGILVSPKRVDSSPYRSLVGSLLYLTATRPDIMFVPTLLSRFKQNPSQIHFGAAKRILRYLQGTLDYDICYKAGKNLNLIAYSDSDWAGSIDDMKSTSGYAFLLAEDEYVTAGKATSQAIWLRRILEDIGEKQKEATILFCNNKSSISIAKNPGGNLQNRTGGGWRPRGTSGVRMRKGFKEKKGKTGIMRIYLMVNACVASGRLGCVRVLLDPNRRNVLDPGYLDGGDVATCPGFLKVKVKCVRVLSDPDRRNVLDPGYLDGGDVVTCPGLPKAIEEENEEFMDGQISKFDE